MTCARPVNDLDELDARDLPIGRTGVTLPREVEQPVPAGGHVRSLDLKCLLNAVEESDAIRKTHPAIIAGPRDPVPAYRKSIETINWPVANVNVSPAVSALDAEQYPRPERVPCGGGVPDRDVRDRFPWSRGSST